MLHQFSAVAKLRAHRIAAASAWVGVHKSWILAHTFSNSPNSFLATTGKEVKAYETAASTFSFIQFLGGGIHEVNSSSIFVLLMVQSIKIFLYSVFCIAYGRNDVHLTAIMQDLIPEMPDRLHCDYHLKCTQLIQVQDHFEDVLVWCNIHFVSSYALTVAKLDGPCYLAMKK